MNEGKYMRIQFERNEKSLTVELTDDRVDMFDALLESAYETYSYPESVQMLIEDNEIPIDDNGENEDANAIYDFGRKIQRFISESK